MEFSFQLVKCCWLFTLIQTDDVCMNTFRNLQLMLFQAKALPQEPLDPVSVGGFGMISLRYRKGDPVSHIALSGLLSVHQAQGFLNQAFAFSKQQRNGSPAFQAMSKRKIVCRIRQVGLPLRLHAETHHGTLVRNGQFLTSFPAATGDDSPAILGLHATAESVLVHSFALGWLKSRLHLFKNLGLQR